MSDVSEKVESVFSSPQGTFVLRRYGHPKEMLRAWNGADSFMLEAVSNLTQTIRPGHVLIVNDDFGALSIALKSYQPDVMIDSAHSRRALQSNFANNGYTIDDLTLMTRFDLTNAPPKTVYDLVLIKIPKSIAQLDDQLRRLKLYLNDSSIVIAGAMAKHIQRSTVHSFETHLGRAQCSLAHKRARLIRVTELHDVQFPPSPMVTCVIPAALVQAETDIELMSAAGTFAHGKLDLGTRALLDILRLPEDAGAILDYGCGNGVLGLVAGLRRPHAHLTFVDDAASAIVSTRHNAHQHLSSVQVANTSFLEHDSLNSVPDNSQCVVLNNPPFHDAGARTSFIARSMFKDAFRVLKPGGELWVVGNRHLGYEGMLRQTFGTCEQMGKHPKFVILRARKSSV